VTAGKYTTLGTTLGAMADAEIAALNALIVSAGVSDEPKAPGSGVIFDDDFTGYKNTTELLTFVQAGKGYLHMNVENGVTLDPTGGIGNTPACRIDWKPKASATPCADDSHLIERVFPATTALCIAWTGRYSPAFVWDWITLNQSCKGNAKKMFLLWAVTGSRFDFICENHRIGIGSDNDHPLFPQLAPEVTPEMIGDGNWHRFTVRVQQSSTPTALDGHIEGWIDGVKKWDIANWPSQSSGGYNDWKMPATFNTGSPVAQSEWIDHLTLWRP